jgi:hypothetical protein
MIDSTTGSPHPLLLQLPSLPPRRRRDTTALKLWRLRTATKLRSQSSNQLLLPDRKRKMMSSR